jgi:hypothetical protein
LVLLAVAHQVNLTVFSLAQWGEQSPEEVWNVPILRILIPMAEFDIKKHLSFNKPKLDSLEARLP